MRRPLLLCPVLLSLLACSDRTTEESSEEWFESVEFRGWNLSGFVGDFDGDGFDDIALWSATEPGTAILYGRPDATLPETPDLLLQTPQGGPPGSSNVSRLGDINGDGLDDIIVSDREAQESTVFFGRPRSLEAAAPGEHSFRISTVGVQALGDLDADGIDDIAATFFPAAQRPIAAIIRGRATWPDLNVESLPADGIVMEDPSAYPQRLGDINGDGYDDLGTSPRGGALSLHSGATLPWGTTLSDTLPAPDLGGLDAPADQTPFLEIPGSQVPNVAVYPLGDLDGDGFDDFAAGHLWSERPVTFVVYGTAEPLEHARASLNEGRGGYRIDGQADSLLAGDVNQDGSRDLVFGGVGDSGNDWILDRRTMPTLSVRAVLQQHPSSAATPSSGVALPRPREARRYGLTMSSGDFNGDGALDLVAGFHVPVSAQEAYPAGVLLRSR